MSVTLNEAALERLLDSPDGPVGRRVQQLSQAIVLDAQQNVRAYFGNAPGVTADQDVDYEMIDGSTAVIGIREVGNKSRRLAAAQEQGKVNWLLSAFERAKGAF